MTDSAQGKVNYHENTITGIGGNISSSSSSSSSRSELLLAAYKEKLAILEAVTCSRAKAKRKIKPNAPIRPIDPTKVPKIADRWWDKPPCIAGEQMNSSQSRLSDPSNYTENKRRNLDFDDKVDEHLGDFCRNPLKARILLLNNSYSDLTIPTRAADFRTGVEWRLQLRR